MMICKYKKIGEEEITEMRIPWNMEKKKDELG